MAWFKGTATDYHDLLDVIKNLAKDDHISVADIYDGGTGYAVGDTITLASGTKYHEPEIEVRGIASGDYITVAAVNAGGANYNIGDSLVPTTGTYSVAPELEVLTVSGTAVATILIKNPGICSAQPSNPVSTTSSGAGTGCTIDFTFAAGTGIITSVHIADAGVYTSQASNPVLQNTSSGSGTGAKFEVTYVDTAWVTKVDFLAKEATAVAISAAGTGYSTDDKVTIVGGTFTEAAVVNVDAQSGGVPSAVSIHSGGEYDGTATPSNPATTSGGTGSGLTLTMTWTDQVEENKYLMLHNTTSDQYIGWQAQKETSPSVAYLLRCTGFTGFNSVSTPWISQPGSTAIDGTEDTYVPLSGGGSPATINYWLSIQDERITGSFKVAAVYPNMYLGAIDRFLTADEWAYPQVILGCTARRIPYTYGGTDFAGMNNPGRWQASDSYAGPGWLRDPAGVLRCIYNWYVSSSTPFYAQSPGVKVSPSGGTLFDLPAGANAWYNRTLFYWRHMFTSVDVISTGQDVLGRYNDLFVLLPATLLEEDVRIYGNMRGIFTLNPDASANAEDRIFIGSDVYRCFQNCAKSNRNYFFCIKED